MTLVLVLVPVWFVVVGCVISMFRIAARGDEVSATAAGQTREPSSELAPDVSLGQIRLPGRRLHLVPPS